MLHIEEKLKNYVATVKSQDVVQPTGSGCKQSIPTSFKFQSDFYGDKFFHVWD